MDRADPDAGDPVTGKQSPRWAFMKYFTIPDAQQPELTHLKRLRIIQTPWFGVYLHWIYLPDRDRDPHDHPWTFSSLVLRGGYREEVTNHALRGTETKCHHAGSIHTMPMWLAHRIYHLEPRTLTLVFVGPRKRIWGFWTPEGFVPWHDYVDADGNRKAGPDPFDS